MGEWIDRIRRIQMEERVGELTETLGEERLPREALLRELNAEQEKLFKTYELACKERFYRAVEQAFEDGFKVGAKIILEIKEE